MVLIGFILTFFRLAFIVDKKDVTISIEGPNDLGGFQLQNLIITELKSHMTC